MTEKKARKLHRELWQWLVDNPGEGKGNWPKWRKIKSSDDFCFACEYSTSECPSEGSDVDKCPPNIKAGTSLGEKRYYDKSECLYGVYFQWFCETNAGKRIKYAEIIRDLWPEVTK